MKIVKFYKVHVEDGRIQMRHYDVAADQHERNFMLPRELQYLSEGVKRGYYGLDVMHKYGFCRTPEEALSAFQTQYEKSRAWFVKETMRMTDLLAQIPDMWAAWKNHQK